MSPFPFFGGCLFFHQRSFKRAPLHFLGGCLFFHQMSFKHAPLCFLGVASFFMGGLLNEPLCIF
jgi:hypothetical protein